MSIQTSKHPCGFCATNTHQYCPGAIYNGDQVTILVCPCGCEQSLKYRCLLCNNKNQTEINPDKMICLDALACVSEYNRKRQITYDQLYPKATFTTKKTTGNDCKCSCGNQTSGGNFKPGHADKLVASLAKEIKAKAMTEDDAKEMLLNISEGLIKKLAARL